MAAARAVDCIWIWTGGEDNYITNKESGHKVFLKWNEKGSYLMQVEFVGGGKADIIVDSGAVDNVCPWEWASEFGLHEVSEENKVKFAGPNGSPIQH